ncbi:MAG: hypothetical protein GY835_24200, partial [bacterium]|nr:hypothetical protein [bacterium]
MAHLKTKATRGKKMGRLRWKIRLIRQLYERGYERQEVLDLFRFMRSVGAMLSPPTRSLANLAPCARGDLDGQRRTHTLQPNSRRTSSPSISSPASASRIDSKSAASSFGPSSKPRASEGSG